MLVISCLLQSRSIPCSNAPLTSQTPTPSHAQPYPSYTAKKWFSFLCFTDGSVRFFVNITQCDRNGKDAVCVFLIINCLFGMLATLARHNARFPLDSQFSPLSWICHSQYRHILMGDFIPILTWLLSQQVQYKRYMNAKLVSETQFAVPIKGTYQTWRNWAYETDFFIWILLRKRFIVILL